MTRSNCETFKVLLIGDLNVGKTSLLQRFANDKFSNSVLYTIGCDFESQNVKVDGEDITLHLWDTAGQERFKTIFSSYYRYANGIIFVYDISNQESFDNLEYWISESDKHSREDVCKMLIGNKNDLSSQQRVVSSEKGEEYAQSLNIPFLETSALSAHNVEIAFISLTEDMVKIRESIGPSTSSTHLDLDPTKATTRIDCC